MRAVCQRVKEAKVLVDGQTVGEIGPGWLVYLAIGHQETDQDLEWLVRRLQRLRLFVDDESGKEARTIAEVGGGYLVISQFTLMADCRKGSKPSWHRSAPPQEGEFWYERFLNHLRQESGGAVQAGQFGAHMEVSSTNDGPITLLLDSRQKNL